jgi:hypothetical protein
MDSAGLNGKLVAKKLGWSESRVSRFLTGKLDPTEIEVSALLAICGVVGVERHRLLGLVGEHGLRWAPQEYQRTLVDHQRKAVRVTDFSGLTVPTLLRTKSYVRSMAARSGDLSVNRNARLAGDHVLERDNPPQCTFFIAELALHLPIGSPLIMSGQLHHLLLMSVRSHITIRVVPTAVGAHAGLVGSCCLMEFTDFAAMVSVEAETAGHFVEESGEISAYQQVFTSLAAVALDQTQSRAVIGQLAVDR